MSCENETVAEIVREARDKYTVHECGECNWRKSCMGRKFGDSECVNERQSISLAFGIGDGYFSGLLNHIEAAHKREILFEIKLSSDYLAAKDIEIERLTALHTSADARKNAELDDLRAKLKVAEDALENASDAFRFCIEQCELELGPKMIGKLCEDGQAVERALAAIREKGETK